MDLPYEIVHVINAKQLIDSESYQHAIEAEQTGRLEPGFYVVLWPCPQASSHYDARAEHIGPFPTRHLAEQVHVLIGAGARIPGAAFGAAPLN
jgi:hypothetical protein